MTSKELRNKLESLHFAENLPVRVLDIIAAESVLRRYRARDIIFREGGENHTLYLIVSGAVALEMCVPARSCTRLLSLGPGDMLAWSALLGSGTMTASAIATDDTEVIAMPARKLIDLCAADHETGYHIMKRMSEALAQRLVATRLQLLDLFLVEGTAGP